MANFETLLQYQRLDIERKKILEEIDRHEFSKRLDKARSDFNAAKTLVNDSEKDAEGIITFYNNSGTFYEEMSKKSEELLTKLNGLDEDSEEMHEIVAQLEVLRDKMGELERKLIERRNRSESVIKKYVDSQDKGKSSRLVYNDYKNKLDTLKAEKSPKITQLNKDMDGLIPKIDQSLLSQYKLLTQEGKYPALVEANTADGGRNFSCCGCGLSLSQKAKSELQEKEVCRCENCRRIIYKK